MKVRSTVLVLCIGLLTAPLLYAEDGAALYKARCAMCHGAAGQGDTPMGKKLSVKNLASADVQKQSDEALAQTITKGKGKMPSFAGKLSADQLKAVITHIRSFAGK